MIELNRLGLGTMGMSIVRNPGNSVKTIHAALDKGITLFNTGEFYNASERELDVKPHNVKGHLTYSLRRLGLDYIFTDGIMSLA